MRSLRAYWIMTVLAFSYMWASWRRSTMSSQQAGKYMEEVHHRNARRLSDMLSSLAGFYTKVGQLISLMTTMLPEVYVRELEKLQDSAPPVPFPMMRKTLEEEWTSAQWQQVRHIESRPRASASIGQVHEAILSDGRRVAVKIQYPDLEEKIRRDLGTVRNILRLLDWVLPHMEFMVIYSELRSMIREEMDFTRELANIRRFSAQFAEESWISAPEPVLDLCSGRVLTLEYVKGIRASDTERMRQEGLDPVQVASRLLDAYALQFFEHGFYHADPHPGNILVVPEPHSDSTVQTDSGQILEQDRDGVPHLPAPRSFRLVFLDFGAACELSDSMRRGMIEFIQAAVKRDTDRLVKALKRMGFIPRWADPRVYDRVIAYFHDRFHENIGFEDLRLSKIKLDASKGMENLADLRAMNISLRDLGRSFRIPSEWVLLERALLLLLGLVSQIAPDLDPMKQLTPHFTRFAKRYGLDPSSLAMESFQTLVLDTTALPSVLRRILSQLATGTLEFHLAGTDRALLLIYASVQEIIFGTLGWLSFQEYLRWRDLASNRAMLYGTTALLSAYLFIRSLFLARNAARGK